jgi:hypothetical protein
MEELAARDFDFGRLSNDIAARDRERPIADLLADLRNETLHRWTPGRGGAHSALNHVVVHGLDAAVPLGLDWRPTQQVRLVVLNDLTTGGVHEHFGTSITGRRLEAADLDWSFGSGPVLRGASTDLTVALCGRRLPSGRLEGQPL